MFANYCRLCCYETSPLMLTTYCLPDAACDRCGHRADLAMVRVGPEPPPVPRQARTVIAALRLGARLVAR